MRYITGSEIERREHEAQLEESRIMAAINHSLMSYQRFMDSVLLASIDGLELTLRPQGDSQ